MDRTDEELVSGYLDGDQASLKSIIDRYTPSVYNFSTRFVGSDLASDVSQEVFIKVWKNIKKYNIQKALFRTWIWTIVRNTVTDYLRKKKLILFSELGSEDDNNIEDTISSEELLPDETLQKIQDKELLNNLLEKLPSHYKEVLILYYQEDLTFDEIGKILNKPLNTVKSQHRRALEKLREMIIV